MIIGIGNDIIEIERIKKALSNKTFFKKIYTEKEQKIFNGKNFHSLAGNFAAKESVSKALGTGFSGFSPIDIEILRYDNGKPYVKLYNNAKKTAENLNIKKIHLSISHCLKYAQATAVAEGE